MTARTRPAPNGPATLYVEHGCWWDRSTKNIHVTIPGAELGAHWSYKARTRLWSIYRSLLIDAGRWPADADELSGGAQPTA